MVDASVLTPSYDYGRFIEDALLSVRRQAGLSVQHVIQDGGSMDGTAEVVSRFQEEVDWCSEPDQGQSDALNKALARAHGRWIAWLNADEFYLPGSLAKLVRIGEETGADVVYGDCVLTDESGRLTRLLPQHRFSARVLIEYGPCISSNSAIFRRSILGDDPWSTEIRRIMDWDLYMKLLQKQAVFLHVQHPVGAFRVHPAQVTSSSWEQWKSEDSVVSVSHGSPRSLAERWRIHKRGRWLHRLHKLRDGAYWREFRAGGLRGKDMRWFDSSLARANVIELSRRCYGTPLVSDGVTERDRE